MTPNIGNQLVCMVHAEDLNVCLQRLKDYEIIGISELKEQDLYSVFVDSDRAEEAEYILFGEVIG